MKAIWQVLIISMMALFYLTACYRNDHKNNNAAFVVEKKSHATVLSYSGLISPIASQVVASPADGIVTNVLFQYGQSVKKGQVLFYLSSTKFIADYKSALMQYFKAKSDNNLNQSQWEEAKFLHRNQLISDDEFKMKQSNVDGSKLALMQASDLLHQFMQQFNINDIDPDKLTISDIGKITNGQLSITAPSDGVVLAPAKGESGIRKWQNGDAVKQGDSLALMGDLHGLSVTINVNEMIVNHLKENQKVIVSGLAFPGEALRGFIKRIDRQGEVSSNGLPVFSVDIIVPDLAAASRQSIYVGMTAKVEISTDEKTDLLIPIQAVHERAGKAFVTVRNPKTGKKSEREIQAGETTPDAVVVIAGLTKGEEIVLPDQA